MILPDLSWQVVYGSVAWALVMAALALALLPARWRRSGQQQRAASAALLLAFAVLNALPGKAAPAYWLGLAFQLPSAFLAALCAVRLFRQWRGRPLPGALPPALAAPLALLGTVLYIDAMGLLAVGWYYAGFGPAGAPLAALLLAALCAWGVMRGVLRPYALALLAALSAFALLRLPTGNLWDSLLDPFLFGWAVASLVALWRRRRAAARQAA